MTIRELSNFSIVYDLSKIRLFAISRKEESIFLIKFSLNYYNDVLGQNDVIFLNGEKSGITGISNK